MAPVRHLDLQITAFGIDVHSPGHLDPVARSKRCGMTSGAAGKIRASDGGVPVLERQIYVPRRRHRKVAHLPRHPDTAQHAAERTADSSHRSPDPQNVFRSGRLPAKRYGRTSGGATTEAFVIKKKGIIEHKVPVYKPVDNCRSLRTSILPFARARQALRRIRPAGQSESQSLKFPHFAQKLGSWHFYLLFHDVNCQKTDLSTELLTASGENTIMLTSTVPTDMQIFIKKSIGTERKSAGLSTSLQQ